MGVSLAKDSWTVGRLRNDHFATTAKAGRGGRFSLNGFGIGVNGSPIVPMEFDGVFGSGRGFSFMTFSPSP